jgi:hypothetical protein
VANGPETVSQLAKDLGLTLASVHTNVNQMMTSELLRESEGLDNGYENRHPSPGVHLSVIKYACELVPVFAPSVTNARRFAQHVVERIPPSNNSFNASGIQRCLNHQSQ